MSTAPLAVPKSDPFVTENSGATARDRVKTGMQANEKPLMPARGTTVTAVPFAFEPTRNRARLVDLVPDIPVIKAADVQGIDFPVYGAEFRISDYKDNPQVSPEYALILTKTATGEDCYISCGGTIVVRKLKELFKNPDAILPVVMRLRSQKQSSGQTLWQVE